MLKRDFCLCTTCGITTESITRKGIEIVPVADYICREVSYHREEDPVNGGRKCSAQSAETYLWLVSASSGRGSASVTVSSMAAEVKFSPLSGVHSGDPLCYLLEVRNPRGDATLPAWRDIAPSVVVSKLACFVGVAQIDDFSFLLDCGWNDQFDVSLLNPLKRCVWLRLVRMVRGAHSKPPALPAA